MILGIDEVGRGPWAGPLVVGAVVLGDAMVEGLTDSKKLTKKRREALDIEIRTKAQGIGLGWVSAKELDELGMSEALREATRRAVRDIRTPYHEIIIDGTINLLVGTPLEKYVTTLAKADALIPSVSAASIVAKVARDNYMKEQDAIYPGYGFGAHAGYGVAKHREAIRDYGVTPLHRLSFAPLAKYRSSSLSLSKTLSERPSGPPNTTRQVGNASESEACRYLEQRGCTIVDRNWRTKWCEIDIIARDGSKLLFVEVKHRKNDKAGDGFAAITAKKLRQMTFAVKLYSTKSPELDVQLAVIATTCDPPKVVDYIELD